MTVATCAASTEAHRSAHVTVGAVDERSRIPRAALRDVDATALRTDHYELTMVASALESGVAHRSAVFEVFARRLPAGRAYGVVAGMNRVIDAIEHFRFTDAAIAHAATIVTAEVVVEEAPPVVEAAPPAGGVGSSAAGPSSSDVWDGEPAPPTRQSSAGRRALARARDSRDKSSSRDNAASLTGPGTGLAEHGAGEAPTSTMPPSPPPSPSSPDGQSASGQTPQAFSTHDCLAHLDGMRRKVQQTAQRVRASSVLQRLLC